MFEVLMLSVILGAVTYRVGRFIVLDTMIEGTRDKVIGWFEARSDKLLYRKIVELFGCPFCITVWVAAGAVFTTRLFVGSTPMPVWVWLATATTALVFWRVVDSE
jgi:hypothetical protein